jgi:hypothetical protein
MKRIGITDHGEMLVVLTQEEHETLLNLARVSEGQANIFMGHLSDPAAAYSYDITQPLQAIIAYTRTLSLLNELALEVDSVRAAVMAQQNKERAGKAPPERPKPHVGSSKKDTDEN